MPLIYITGPTGCGKSTVCDVLRNEGHTAYDTDSSGMRKIALINGKELMALDIALLQKIHDTTGNEIVYICGTSPNDQDAFYLFSKIFLLIIDASEQKKRILQRTNSVYGKQPSQMIAAQKWRKPQIEKYINAGAIVIDATQPLEDIIAKIQYTTLAN